MFKLTILEKAVFETREAFEWYESKSIGLGKRFNTELRKTLTLIRQQPDRYAIKKELYREVRLKKIPYLIIYQIDEEAKEIAITSIFHVKRNPEKKY